MKAASTLLYSIDRGGRGFAQWLRCEELFSSMYAADMRLHHGMTSLRASGGLANPTRAPAPAHPSPRSAVLGQMVVAYAFLVASDLHLWDVWLNYFSQCPSGSVLILVHAQEPSPHLVEVVSNASRNGLPLQMLPADKVVKGSLRFSWSMVQAMLALYRELGNWARLPTYVHMLSDSCVPIAPCPLVHAALASRAPNKSFITITRRAEQRGKRLLKGLQWHTLWGEHALLLARDEANIFEKWGRKIPNQSCTSKHCVSLPQGGSKRGAIDEWLFPNALEERGLQFDHPGLTFASMAKKRISLKKQLRNRSRPGGHGPPVYSNYDDAMLGCKQAQLMKFLFMRKFAWFPESGSFFRSCCSETLHSNRALVKTTGVLPDCFM